MKCPHCHFLLLIIASLGFWVAGSGCAEYNEFVGDFSGGHYAPPPQYAASSQPGNWLDHLLPNEAPGPCQHCQQGPTAPGQMMGPGPNGLVYEAPPSPQNVPARLHPVPTHPVFSPPPATLATANRPNQPGRVAAEQPIRNGGALTPKTSENPVRRDPSPRTARVIPAPRKEPLPADDFPANPMPAPKETAEPKSEIQPMSAVGEHSHPIIAKPTPNPTPISPLQLNAPVNAELIAPSSATAAQSANVPASTATEAVSSPSKPGADGWHTVLRGGYSSR